MAKHAMTHPEEQTPACASADGDCVVGDVWVRGPTFRGLGGASAGSSQIFIRHGLFTNNRAVDLFINE